MLGLSGKAAADKAASEERPGEAVDAEAAIGIPSPTVGTFDGKKDSKTMDSTFSTAAPTDTAVATGFRSTVQGSSKTVSFRATAPVSKDSGGDLAGHSGP